MILLEVGPDIINNTNGNLRSVIDQWNQIWLTTFNGNQNSPDSVYFHMVAIAKLVAAVGAFFAMLEIYTYTQKIQAPVQVALAFSKLGFLALMFYNNCANTGELAFGIRSVTNGWQKDILATQINAVSFNSAINDQFMQQDARNLLRELKNKCDAIILPNNVTVGSLTRPSNPNPPLTESESRFYDKMECYDNLGQESQRLQQEAVKVDCSFLNIGGDCKGLIGWLEKFQQDFSNNRAKNIEQVQKTGKLDKDYVSDAINNWLTGETVNPGLQSLFYSMQFGFTQLMEAGHWIAGISGPLAVVLSLFPNQGMPLFLQWIITLFSIGLMKIYYVLIVGVAAQSLGGVTNNGFSDNAFGLVMGVLAPVVAFALATGGAIAAINGMAGTSLAVIQGVSTLGASVIGGAAGLIK